ncbi:MAG TPA: hypothetical protein VE077_20140 [Candidatus Methylomirabilis sp.]|nr:hypothetical protein [Candidatus Methylomirabilis sp.]
MVYPAMEASAIREQIERIQHSQSFASKGQLRKLLEVLSKNIDSQNNLNPELVIRELWPTEIRTKRSADVATEMNRLRHALEVYYEEEGKADPIAIVLPNRAAPARNGKHEKRWIVAKARNGEEIREEDHRAAGDRRPGVQANPRRVLKTIGTIAAVGVLCIVAYVAMRILGMPDQPRLGRLDASKLVVTNAEGKELWSKSFPKGFGPDTYYGKEFGTKIWFADLEGKGHTSVLFSYLPAPSSQAHSSELICYSDRGKEKWRWTPGKDLPEVGPATYKTFFLGLLKATDRRSLRIVVVSNADPWYGGPGQVALLDSNGKTVSEYWHSGGLRDMAVADLDGDGRQEIMVTGVAHGYDTQATLVVLDSDRVFGASREVRPEFQLHRIGEAQERLRLLFPRSDLNRASFQFNFPIEPTVRDGTLRLNVQECTAPMGCSIWYEFNKNLQLIAVRPGNDEFRSAHDNLYQNGKDVHALSAEELATFLRVRCLVGCKSELVPVAETYNPVTSFENGWTTHCNPNGVWSYGYSSGFTSPITLYDKTVRNGINGPNAKYWLSSSVHRGTSPAVAYNDGPAFDDGNSALLANEFDIVAGLGGQYSNLIFTAPADGEYSIAGDFRGAQYGVGTVVGVVADGKIVFSSKVTFAGEHVPFRIAPSLQAGSTVVFSVGPGGGNQNTGLSIAIAKPCGLNQSPTLTPTGEITCSSLSTGNRRTK